MAKARGCMIRKSATQLPGVLVVDDHAISRRYIAAALRQSDWYVKQAATAGEARLIALSWRPRLILIDINLGATNGLELARRIWDGWPDSLQKPRIVMLSADPPDPHQMNLSSHCVDGFLLKPVSTASLLAMMEPALHGPAPAHRPGQTLSGLQPLFRQELSMQMGHLDRYLAAQDLAAAGSILHQLIASSSLCRQPSLERALRSLGEACRTGAGAHEIGCEYFSLLVSVRDFLAPGRLIDSN